MKLILRSAAAAVCLFSLFACATVSTGPGGPPRQQQANPRTIVPFNDVGGGGGGGSGY
jgi:hypothetical protein